MFTAHPACPYNFIQKIAALPFVDKIVLYGSRARGTHRERSDIDLAVSCPGATFLQWEEVMRILEDTDTLLHVDCVRLDELQQGNSLLQEIMREGVTLYQRD